MGIADEVETCKSVQVVRYILRPTERLASIVYSSPLIHTRPCRQVCIAATSAWMDAVESASQGSPAFALTRPPGHHATASVSMGKRYDDSCKGLVYGRNGVGGGGGGQSTDRNKRLGQTEHMR